MSTVHSTPPATAVGKRSHPVGFNHQTYCDPFLAPLHLEEHLIPIASDHSPSHYSHHTPTSSQSSKHTSGSPPQTVNHLDTLSHIDREDTLPTSHLSQYNTNHEATGAYDFLSPGAYMSDAGYIASSEHTATPEFGGNGFHFEDDYSMLAELNHTEFNELLPDGRPQYPQDSADLDNIQPSIPTRTSAGAATLSSHLMSPVLTDSGGPTSRHGTKSPPEEIRIKGEGQDTVVTDLFVQHPNSDAMDHMYGPTQITPSMTESSQGTSPNLSSAAPMAAQAMSPMIRVDGYSRGDSPARESAMNHPHGSKRSRAGSNVSHLTVQHNQHAKEEDDYNDYFGAAPVTSNESEGRSGLDPDARNQLSNVIVPNLRDQELQSQVDMKNMDVEEWLNRSEPSDKEPVDAPPSKPSAPQKRQRAKSAGAQILSHENLESLKHSSADSHIPGPGVLINEESGDEDYDEDESASIENSPPPSTAIGNVVNQRPGEAMAGVYDELPNQPPLYRAKLWQDALYDSSDPGVKMQPETANAAMVRYEQRAGDIETLSRVATWGTRRVSESDLNSLFHRLSFGEKTQEPVKGKRDRRGSFLHQLSGKLSSKRSNSNLKRQDSDKSIKTKDKPVRPQAPDHDRKDSLEVPQVPQSGLKRMSSLGKRPKSPRINTSSAVAAMAFQAGALGAGGSVSATGTSSPTAWPKNIMRRPRSRSEMNNLGSQGPASSSATELGQPGLAEMWTRQGGPPMPTLATPLKNEETLTSLDDVEDEDEDDGREDHGITMDLSIRPGSIAPTLEGFKANIRELNPRLPPFMFDRIAQEQLRRFKKLMDFKIKHAQALSVGKCASGKHCAELGGEPTYLPSRSSNRQEPELSQMGFTVAGLAHSDEEANALAEGVVTPAQFPPGVPLPPVKRLPAEFECSLCFKVKKFHKPSDWSKHVHEDVQPFTCTFPTCAEPKSFKRKADWVRHENERHRQLEWWMCNINDCSHKCYRKDNFVQHLVREHKLPEPKVKTTKIGKPAVRGPSSQKARNRHAEDTEESNDEIDYVWRLVDECRHETRKNPKDEACKFCGNICNSWKKLTVHLARHMEQISMPVLGVVKEKEVTPDTIISPIEQRIASQQNSVSPTVQSPFPQTAQVNSISSYGVPTSGGSDFPGAFTSLQPRSSYLGGGTTHHPPINYQRISPNTYPPPSHAQQLNAVYPQVGGQGPYVSEYSPYATESPGSNFHTVNNNTSLPHHQASSPENMYGDNTRLPTSQPRASPFDDSKGFQYFPQQPPSQPNQIDSNVFQYSNAAPPPFSQPTASPTSYPSQQRMSNATHQYSRQGASAQGQIPLQFIPIGGTPNYPPVNGYVPLNTPQQHYPYGQQ